MRLRTCTALAAVTLSAAGCWGQLGGSSGRTYHAPWEQRFTPANADDLVEVWRSPIPPTSRGTGAVRAPVSQDGVVYAADAVGGLAAFDLATGALRWGVEQYLWFDDFVVGDPVVLDDSYGLLVPLAAPDQDPATSYYSRDGGHHLGVYGGGGPLALTSDGWASVWYRSSASTYATLNYTYDRVSPSVALASDGTAPAYALAGEVALWSDGSDAVAFDCPLSTPDPPPCEPTWRTPLGESPVAPAVVGPDSVAYLDVGGTVHVLDLATGAVRFRAAAGSAVSVAPAVAGDTILVATDAGRLVALPADGCGEPWCRPLWSAAIGTAPVSPPVVGAEVAFVARDGGGIAAFGLAGCGGRRCPPLTVLPTAAEVTGGPILEPGRLVAGLADGSVAAYGL